MKDGRTVLEAKRLGFVSCSVTDQLRDIAEKMVDSDISSLVVTTEEGHLAGVITRTDLLRAYWEHENWAALQVHQFMSSDVVTVTPQTLLRNVAHLLLERHIHRVVVVDEHRGHSRPLAVVSSSDLVYHMLRAGVEVHSEGSLTA
jgi:signal-transduction protein with cAMP-binding, CBS, and nucleotidyltransferase domain